MVGRWGMSEQIGPLAVLPADAQGPLLPGADAPSGRTLELVDAEARRIVDDAHAEVTELLTTNRARLDALAQALLEHDDRGGIARRHRHRHAAMPGAGLHAPVADQQAPHLADGVARRGAVVGRRAPGDGGAPVAVGRGRGSGHSLEMRAVERAFDADRL
jgi:hypothetical protein